MPKWKNCKKYEGVCNPDSLKLIKMIDNEFKDLKLKIGYYDEEKYDPYIYLYHEIILCEMNFKIDIGVPRSAPALRVCIKKKDNSIIFPIEYAKLMRTIPELNNIHIADSIEKGKSLTLFYSSIICGEYSGAIGIVKGLIEKILHQYL